VKDEMLNSSALRPTPPVDAAIAALAARQHGVVALGQLAGLGLDRNAVAYRVRVGRLHRLHPGVFAVGHAVVTRRGRFMAAVLSCGDRALLSHRSAAVHWGLLSDTGARAEVSTPRQRRSRPGVRVHVTRTLVRRDAAIHDGIPITSVARTLLDLADVAPPRHVERALHQADVLRLFDLRALDAVLARANGRRGAAVLRAALAEPPVFTRSEFEEAFLALVRAAGLPAPRMNAFAEGFEVDAYWPDHKLAVELDSRRYHFTRKRFETDRERDIVLLRAGVRTARVTDTRLSRAPQGVAGDLRALLAR
jgi:very-short-patch-repair endonuclease